ncbi:hypothetical protein GCM10025870_12610 [Agromyces marinus]|uniref:Carbohydrate ABC transporter permease n=1 Tax=Agromyces marinus TaxID=1389020 RepID=A0ABM8H096_9MICO|nr:hypothetical protein [Agromyces marinus]BDZ54188.1 hypothetical protein GCM10025870_12610 [Agromyces marinus]
MTGTDLSIVRGEKTFAQRILGFFGNAFVNVLLILVAVFWLVPSIGLFITSFRSSADSASSGWWTVFTAPAQLTLENYANLIQNPTIMGSLWNTIVIVVPTTIAVAVIGSLAGYAFAWIDFLP